MSKEEKESERKTREMRERHALEIAELERSLREDEISKINQVVSSHLF